MFLIEVNARLQLEVGEIKDVTFSPPEVRDPLNSIHGPHFKSSWSRELSTTFSISIPVSSFQILSWMCRAQFREFCTSCIPAHLWPAPLQGSSIWGMASVTMLTEFLGTLYQRAA